MKLVEQALAGLLGAGFGASLVYWTAHPDKNVDAPALVDGRLRTLETKLDAVLSTLQGLSESPPATSSNAQELPSAQREFLRDTASTDDVDYSAQLQELKEELAQLRTAVLTTPDRLGSSRPSLRAHWPADSSPQWEKIDRFTAACDSDEHWREVALREVFMMTQAELVAKFGPPTSITSQWWSWTPPKGSRRPGSLIGLDVYFTDGLVSEVTADRE